MSTQFTMRYPLRGGARRVGHADRALVSVGPDAYTAPAAYQWEYLRPSSLSGGGPFCISK